MLSSGCIATQSGVPTNPLACANLNLPHYGGGNDGWRINFGWVVDHPVASSLILMILLTIAKALVQSRKARLSSRQPTRRS
jgi:hypothetical protein